MKKYAFVLIGMVLFAGSLHAQIKNVIVETYYVSDANDATDTTAGRSLEAGSKTYRVYIDLAPGSKIIKLYGNANHRLKIASTDYFFNNVDRPAAYFGYLVNKTWFADNPTIALDSWLTLGLATKTQTGILKTEDTDGSIIGGGNNNGGSAGIPGGLLVNNDVTAGIPLTTSDGLILNSTVFSQWVDYGFKDGSGIDTTVFGSVNTGSAFNSDSVSLQQNSGVSGMSPDSNRVLVAQLTTRGDISFELNIEVEETDSLGGTTTVNYVASDSILLPGERVSPFLKYPQVCGCRDANYLEYSAAYACDNSDSCRTKIVFGCMDPLSCNYDPHANFNIPSLCCYPGFCNDRDISVVCPQLSSERKRANNFVLYPNPANNNVSLKIEDIDQSEIRYVIYNSFGRIMREKTMGTISGNLSEEVNISDLNSGLYLFRLYVDDYSVSKTLMKD